MTQGTVCAHISAIIDRSITPYVPFSPHYSLASFLAVTLCLLPTLSLLSLATPRLRGTPLPS